MKADLIVGPRGAFFTKRALGVLVFFAFLFVSQANAESRKNGFVIDAPLVPEREILLGGPPKDGIPAISRPKFVSASEAKDVTKESRVLGISYQGVSKAYPLDIMSFHEVVNDYFAKSPVVVSYCPLCGTGIAFEAEVKGLALEFGVSGLLYNSDLLMYDKNTDSLWSQIKGLAINGKYKSERMKRIAIDHTTWGDWYQRHPDTLVLTRETGVWRDYDSSPYPGYENSEHLYFPVDNVDKRYHPKEYVVGVEINGKRKAYPFVELSQWLRNKVEDASGLKGEASRIDPNVKYVLSDKVAGQDILIYFTPEHRTAYILDEAGQKLPSTMAYWFAWMAFFPDSMVYKFE